MLTLKILRANHSKPEDLPGACGRFDLFIVLWECLAIAR